MKEARMEDRQKEIGKWGVTETGGEKKIKKERCAEREYGEGTVPQKMNVSDDTINKRAPAFLMNRSINNL